MIKPLLSILIPTVNDRDKIIENLIDKICGDRLYQNDIKILKNPESFVFFYTFMELDIELIIWKDNKELTIGEKREELYKLSNGFFSWQIDDDDDIALNAIELILEAIKNNPEVDCITFEEYCNMDGKEYKSNHSLSYSGWYGDGSHLLHDGFHFHRTPFFKDVIKTEIAKSVPIRHIRFGEDNFWADDLHPHLKTEVHIPEQLYRYIHNSTPSHERYGFDKD